MLHSCLTHFESNHLRTCSKVSSWQRQQGQKLEILKGSPITSCSIFFTTISVTHMFCMMSKQQGWQKSVRGSPYTYKCTRRNASSDTYSASCAANHLDGRRGNKAVGQLPGPLLLGTGGVWRTWVRMLDPRARAYVHWRVFLKRRREVVWLGAWDSRVRHPPYF